MPHLTNDSDYYTTAYLMYLGEVKTEAATATKEQLIGTAIPTSISPPGAFLDAPVAATGEILEQTIFDTNTAAVAANAIAPHPGEAAQTTTAAAEILKAAIAAQNITVSTPQSQAALYTPSIDPKITQAVAMIAPMLAPAPSAPIFTFPSSVYNILKYIKPGS